MKVEKQTYVLISNFKKSEKELLGKLERNQEINEKNNVILNEKVNTWWNFAVTKFITNQTELLRVFV